ncbi:hypothetical protein CC2G_010047 [Coprinopsis cinerea AmutBmut pab1-1]|nr:hypothetical protein CC2G_010047 [Coprinopsis cinerea AmutBmut pab1-1]
MSSLKIILGTPLEEADQNQIDLWLADLRQHDWKLRQRRNDLSSISQLPDEILLQIFLECRDISNSLSWTTITHTAANTLHTMRPAQYRHKYIVCGVSASPAALEAS